MSYPVRPERSAQGPQSKARRGSAIVLVGVMIGVMLITISFAWISAGGEYNQHAMVLYGTRATLYAQAALKEAGLQLGRKLSTVAGRDEVAGGPWADFEARIRQSVVALPANQATGLLHQKTFSNLATWATSMAAEGEARVKDIHVAFGGFHRIDTAPPDTDLSRPEVYYQDPFQVLDKAPATPADPDIEGFVTISVTVAFEGPRMFLERHAQAQQVLKFTGGPTAARDFVLFAWGDTRGNAADPPMASDLNEGGSLLLFGRRQGRIFLRGPYALESQGYRAPYCSEDLSLMGPGGSNPDPRVSPGILPQGPIDPANYASSAPYQWVDCWGTMPAPRAGVLELCGPLFLRALIPQNAPQIRPRQWTTVPLPTCPPPTPPINLGQALQQWGQGVLIGLGHAFFCLIDFFLPIDWLNSCWIAESLGDPGMKIQFGQWWWVETEAMRSTGDQPDYFSIAGATVPDSQGRVRISPFRGVMMTEVPSGTAPVEPKEFLAPEELFDRMPLPVELELDAKASHVVFVEGVAETLYHRGTMCGNSTCESSYTVSIDRANEKPEDACNESRGYAEYKAQYQPQPAALGLYWAPQETADTQAALLADFLNLVLTVAGGAIGGKFGNCGKLLTRILVGAVVGSALDSVIESAATAAWRQNKQGNYGVSDAPAAQEFRYPVGYRMPERSVIRRYRTLAEYPGLLTHERNPDMVESTEYDRLFLDGEIQIDDLHHDRPLLYKGRGAIVTDDKDNPYLTAPIIAEDMLGYEKATTPELYGAFGNPDTYKGYLDPTAASDALTIFARGAFEEPWTDAGGLTFRVAPAFELEPNMDRPSPVHAWINSHQGVRPEKAGIAIRVVGNLVCYYANRRYIPPGSRVEVLYRPSPPAPESRTVSLSPAWSAYAGGAK